MARSRMHRRYTRNPGTPAPKKNNPPLFTDLLEFVGPGFASFAATRFATRITSTQIAKVRPNLSKHAGAGISVAAFLAAWFLAHRVKWLEKYHTPITVGAAIAALQSLIQIYVPKLGWMISDASPEIDAAVAAPQLAAARESADLQPVDVDPNEFTYDDSYDAGRYSKTGYKPGQSPPIMNRGDGNDEADISDIAMDDAIGQGGNLGVFSPAN